MRLCASAVVALAAAVALGLAAGPACAGHDGILLLRPGHPAQTDVADSDGDFLSDEAEERNGTDPHNPDTDGDGVGDGIEVWKATNPLARDWNTSDWNRDTDGDGETDNDEIAQGTDPLSADTDGDGMLDCVDANPTHPDRVGPEDDWDGDGLTNGQEGFLGLNRFDSSDADKARGIVESKYTGDEIHDADIRVLGGVAATPEEQQRFADAVAAAIASPDPFQQQRGLTALSLVDGKEIPEEIQKALDAKLGRQLADALAKLKTTNPIAAELLEARAAALAGAGDTETTPHGPYVGKTESGSSDSESGGGGKESTEGGRSGSDPGELPETGTHQSSGGSSSGGDGSRVVTSEEWTNSDGSKETATATKNADGTMTYVYTRTDADGSTTTRTVVEDDDGNVVSDETETTAAPDEEEDEDEEEYCAETQDTCGVSSAGSTGLLFFGEGGDLAPSHGEQISHPMNDPTSGGGPGDVDGDGDPELVTARLSGVTDPSPEGGTLTDAGGSGSPAPLGPHAGPEYGPDGPNTVDTSGGPQNPGNGPISLHP
jgi:hypothetical protein